MFPRPAIITRRALLTGAASAAAYAVLGTSPARAATTTWDATKASPLILLSGGNLATDNVYMKITFAFDIGAKKIWAYNSNTGLWNGDVLANQNPETGVGGFAMSTLNAGPYYAMAVIQGLLDGGDKVTANFGASTIEQLPSGFSTFNAAAGTTVTWATAFNSSGQITYTNGNLTAQKTSSGTATTVRSSSSLSSGKVCWEILAHNCTNTQPGFGNGSLTNIDYMGDGTKNGTEVTAVDTRYLFNNVFTGNGTWTTDVSMSGRSVLGTVGQSSGKLMFECLVNYSVINASIGVANGSLSLSNSPGATNGWAYGVNNGTGGFTQLNGGAVAGGQDAAASGTKVGVYVDIPAKKLWYYVPASARYNSDNLANPATGTNGINISVIVSGLLYPAGGSTGEGSSANWRAASSTVNFAGSFSSPVPTGFIPWDSGVSGLSRRRGFIMP